MNIKKINNVNNVTFQKRKKDNKRNYQNTISFNITEQEQEGKKQIVITFLKEQFTSFLASLLSKHDQDKNNIEIEDQKTNLTDEKSAKKEKEPTIQGPIFPSPKFTLNPSVSQRDEYVNELLTYINSTPDTKLHLRALGEIEKYGMSDIDNIATMLLSEDEEVIRETLKIYQKYGSSEEVFKVIGPIRREKFDIKEDETFIEVLKTIQKLAHLENDDPKDREIILRPVRRLLEHKSEKVRKAAQETLNKLKG